MLQIEKLTVSYGAIPVVRKISLDVPRGRTIAIIGANGAGKSTLLKAISGLIADKTGRIRFEDRNITHYSADRIVGLGLSQVAEGRQIFAHMSVEDNIQLGGYLYRGRKARQQTHQRMAEIYAMFPILAKRAKQIAGSLSGGEQQMLAIARALMTRPKLLLLDEPSMGLAPIIVQEIFTVLRRLNQAGMPMLLVEQNARVALQTADYGYVLETGRVVLEGLAEELLQDPKVKAAYLGG